MVETGKLRSGKRNPAYAPWAQVSEFLRKIRVLNPKVIDRSYLEANKMGGQYPSLLLGTIRFLGLINEKGEVTDKLDSIKVKGDEQYKAALRRIVTEAYKDIFEACDVESADRDLIYNQMRAVYNCSTRIADSATPLFLALCEEAGIKIGEREQKAPVAKRSQEGRAKRPEVAARKAVPAGSSLPYILSIAITPEMSEDDILNILLKAEKARGRFEKR